MNKLLVLFIALTGLALYGCGTGAPETNLQNENTGTQSKYATALPANKSQIEAEVEGIYVKDSNDFFIEARILKVDSVKGYANYAIPGAKYILSPDFKYGADQKVSDSPSNQNLKELIKLRTGDMLNGIISFHRLSGWYIEKKTK